MNQETYKVIKDRILFLEYAPAQILNENVLAKEFNVSRTPMREVLIRLEWEKLARVIPRTGTMVTEIEFQQMMNVFQARFEMEGLAGRLAAENTKDTHLEKIASLIKHCKDLLNKSDVDRKTEQKKLVKIDSEYRTVIYDAVNNSVITEVLQKLYEQTFRLWFTTLNIGEWDMEVQALVDELSMALDVFSGKNPEEAFDMRKRSLANHFERIKNKFLGSL